jgi:hypothetical protein
MRLGSRVVAVTMVWVLLTDAWMPTVPTSTDTPRGAWKVKQYDASDKFVGWVVLDEITGDPLQVGHTGG